MGRHGWRQRRSGGLRRVTPRPTRAAFATAARRRSTWWLVLANAATGAALAIATARLLHEPMTAELPVAAGLPVVSFVVSAQQAHRDRTPAPAAVAPR